MKVLFAVNNENISESIIKKYQQEYKEIISVKNVYYFNAIIKELQRDKSYDRIVISEDLQPFSNNNYEQIDKFIFEKMDNISDEATNLSGNDIPIILICTDRRTKSEPLLVKLFGIGVYNALIGKDRSITQVCELLAKPRTKKEAKVYYHIDSEDVDYKVENEGDVSEVEIQNILNHYKKLGGNEEKYVESFDHIASQYTDSQLRLIAKFLPLNVKAVLEANSLKYQEVISFGRASSTGTKVNKNMENIVKPKETTKKEQTQFDLIQKNLNKGKMSEPIVIPSAINTSNMQKNNINNENVQMPVNQADNFNINNLQTNSTLTNEIKANVIETNELFGEQLSENGNEQNGVQLSENSNEQNRAQLEENNNEQNGVQLLENEPEITATPKRRGRPKKVQVETTAQDESPKRGRGRPKKIVAPVEEENSEQMDISTISQSAPVNLFELGEEPVTNTNNVDTNSSNIILPGLEDFEEDYNSNTSNEPENVVENGANSSNPSLFETQENVQNNAPQNEYNPNPIQTSNNYTPNLSGLVSKSQKVVAFVGTSKNGTSFLVNNIAELISQKGINTAILDLTKNKNAYYIYTENEENLRETAYTCIDNLRKGSATGIQVHKNLTVYTTLPGADEAINDYATILQTLTQNYSLVILDCDFETDYHYFNEAQELYLVQSLDVLTIQPLTAFLRNLKAKNVLYPEKIRIVLNKVVRLRSITEKTIIGGMAYYNDPSMSFMTELFNKDTVTYCSIPFEEQAYSKYLEGLVNCKISLNGFSKNFMNVLNKLGDMVYPLINNSKNKKGGYNQYNNYQNNRNNFSGDMNTTLNKMKSNY